MQLLLPPLPPSLPPGPTELSSQLQSNDEELTVARKEVQVAQGEVAGLYCVCMHVCWRCAGIRTAVCLTCLTLTYPVRVSVWHRAEETPEHRRRPHVLTGGGEGSAGKLDRGAVWTGVFWIGVCSGKD